MSVHQVLEVTLQRKSMWCSQDSWLNQLFVTQYLKWRTHTPLHSQDIFTHDYRCPRWSEVYQRSLIKLHGKPGLWSLSRSPPMNSVLPILIPTVQPLLPAWSVEPLNSVRLHVMCGRSVILCGKAAAAFAAILAQEFFREEMLGSLVIFVMSLLEAANACSKFYGCGPSCSGDMCPTNIVLKGAGLIPMAQSFSVVLFVVR